MARGDGGGRPVALIPLGQRYGRLVVLERVGGRWRCACDCGGAVVARGRDLRDGTRRSCGCRRAGTSETTLRLRRRLARGGAPAPARRFGAVSRDTAPKRLTARSRRRRLAVIRELSAAKSAARATHAG